MNCGGEHTICKTKKTFRCILNTPHDCRTAAQCARGGALFHCEPLLTDGRDIRKNSYMKIQQIQIQHLNTIYFFY